MNTFPKHERLLKTLEFKQTLNHGLKFVCREFVVLAIAKTDASTTQVGMIVSKKLGNAVARNRIKRKMREAYRTLPDQKKLDQCNIVLIARHGAANRELLAYSQSLVFCFAKLKKILAQPSADTKVPPLDL